MTNSKATYISGLMEGPFFTLIANSTPEQLKEFSEYLDLNLPDLENVEKVEVFLDFVQVGIRLERNFYESSEYQPLVDKMYFLEKKLARM